MRFDQLKRLEFIKLLGTAAAWPLSARAQQPTPVVGFLHAGSAAASSSQVIAFHAGLNENGFVDGRRLAPLVPDANDPKRELLHARDLPTARFGEDSVSRERWFGAAGPCWRIGNREPWLVGSCSRF